MIDPRIITFLRRTAECVGRPGPATPDAVLLECFVRGRDPAAFAELVSRHGPAVWALCRRLLRSEPDAEDVFQATFLVLARQAGRVRKAASVGSWLYGVASRIGRKARARAERRPPDPARLPRPGPPPDPADRLTWSEVRAALDEELARLPDGLRAPLLLCYFRGLTQDEAAAELGWKPRTLKARVARGRDLLRARLTRRGVELPAALAAPLLAAGFTSAVPPRVTAGLATAAVNVALQRPPGAGVSPAAVELARTGVSAMTTARTAFLAASAVALVTAGTVLGLRGNPAAEPQTPPAPVGQPARTGADPLPPGAIARMGTTKLRQLSWHKRVFFTTDGQTLIVTDDSNKVRWWDPVSGRLLHQLEIPRSGFGDSDCAPGTGLLATIGTHWIDEEQTKTEETVWLVDTVGRKVVRTLRIREVQHSVERKVRFTPDGKRVVSATDQEVRVWDVRTGDELIRWKVPNRDGMSTLAVSPDGKTVAFGHFDVYLWRWEAGEEPRKFVRIGNFGTELMAFAPDGKALYVQPLAGGPLIIFDVATGRQTGTLDIGGLSRSLSFSPDGTTLAVGYVETTSRHPLESNVTLWDVATGAERGRLPVGRAVAEYVRWSPDGARLAAASDGRLFAWDVKAGQLLCPDEPGHEGQLNALTFSPDGRLFIGCEHRTVRSWDAATGRAGLVLVQDGWVDNVAVSPDGSLVAGSALRNDLRVWDARTGAQRFKLLGHGGMGGKQRAQFTADGARLVTWGADEYLRVWDMRNGKLLAEHTTRTDGKAGDLDVPIAELAREESMMMSGADISRDGSALALSSWTAIRVFDTATGRERLKFEVGPGGATHLAFSPDGKRLVIAGQGKPIQTKLPDGRTRESTANEYPIVVWDLSDPKQVWSATDEGWWPSEVGFSPDGARVAALGVVRNNPRAVRFWDAATGKDAGRINLPLAADHFAFDRTGKRLAVTLRDTTAMVYDLETAIQPTPAK